jgi:hypothetical protein
MEVSPFDAWLLLDVWLLDVWPEKPEDALDAGLLLDAGLVLDATVPVACAGPAADEASTGPGQRRVWCAGDTADPG